VGTGAPILAPQHSLDELLFELQEGGIYVNVHTNDVIAPIDMGPGDFPGGEIRGQFGTRGRRRA